MGERTEELKTLETIYPELKIYGEESAHIELSITFTEPLHVFAGSAPQHHRTVTHLPPISIDFSLPEQYPSDAPPLVKLDSATSWLPAGVAKDLEAATATLWEDYGHCEILFAYISHVQEAVEKNFGLDQLAVSSDCFNKLIKYDRQTTRDEFKKGSHACTICLTPKPGLKCYRMEHCGHIFCIECLQAYYNASIESGDVHNVQCLGTEGIDVRARRTKKTRHISPRELLQIPLERDVVQRYADMKRKKRLEADKATVWCPRKWCQGAAKGSRYPKPTVPIEEMDGSDTEDEDVMVPPPTQALSTLPDVNEDAENHGDPSKHGDRLSICEDCGLAFCKICRLTWHGELTWCYPDFRKNPRIIVEEQASLDYIATHTSPCPVCSAPVSKTAACTHMTCGLCRAHFCYLCSQELDRTNPYVHFNTEGTPCYRRLWVLEEGGKEENVVFHGVRGAGITALKLAEEARQREQQQRAKERREHFEQLARERQERFEQRLSKRASN